MAFAQSLYVLVCVVVAASSARSAVAHTTASNPFLPRWTAPMPDASKPLAGYAYVANRSLTEVYHAVPEVGTYNHAAMIDYHAGRLLLTWKCSPENEDQAGQRVLYSQSSDGVHWTPVSSADHGDSSTMFPNMSTSANPAHLFAEPPVHVNGRLYAAASPIQFCLWPDQYWSVLLLRRVYEDRVGHLGPIFWAATSIPKGFEQASKLRNVVTVDKMDVQTQQDIATLQDPTLLPCGFPDTDDTLKCEACLDGCQEWTAVHDLANERTHYVVPGTNDTSHQLDVLLYRSHVNKLYASVRDTVSGEWPAPQPTNIPDEDSNLNAGALPDGSVYLVSNCNAGASIRNPLTIAVTTDGKAFGRVWAVLSCTELAGPDQPNGCVARYVGKSKNPGPSYPQAVTVLRTSTTVPPGLYVVATNNKEDVWVTKLPLAFDSAAAAHV